MLIDSHAHIQGKEYAGEAEAVIARAHEAGVEVIVAVGGAGDMSSNSDAVRLANSFPTYMPPSACIRMTLKMSALMSWQC